MPERPVHGRRAGVLVPLFSIPSAASWGIGEIGDLPAFAAWARACGTSVIQLLPINEMAEGQSSPYSALSAMAIDPIFISVRDVEEFGGEQALTREQREQLREVRSAGVVEHRDVRELKHQVLCAAFDEFLEDWRRGGPRAEAMNAYVERERWWLDEYALFRALHADQEGRYWIEWDTPIRTRNPEAIDAARTRLHREILFYTWLQWIAGAQWAEAHRASVDVAILGDFPFMVSGDSADVWARQHEFRVDASVGVPPDAFSETGQDWGLPVYRWDVLASGKFEWLRQRARRCAELFDGFRVDHLVGFYRTFVRERDGRTYFIPADEPAQLQQGEELMRLFQESGAATIAEDLGTVPDFVRASLTRLGVPGLKVLRWEREWEREPQPFRDPARYPATSVGISGTHDTETVAEWWDNADAAERVQAVRLPVFEAAGITAEEPFSDRIRDAVIEALFASGSDLVLLPVQDVFGWRDRINVPARVDAKNWSWRLPWPTDRLTTETEARERAAYLRELAKRYDRR